MKYIIILLILLSSCTTTYTLHEPCKRDLIILENNYPFLIVEKWNYKIKTIYRPCDSCGVGDLLIFDGFN